MAKRRMIEKVKINIKNLSLYKNVEIFLKKVLTLKVLIIIFPIILSSV